MDEHKELASVVSPRERICRLLELTQPVATWQPHLVQLLGQPIMEVDSRRAVGFLQHVMTVGKATLKKRNLRVGRKRNRGDLLPMDKSLAPKFDIDVWKRILIALGFEIEQPDGYHTVDYVDVLVGDGLMKPTLDGMMVLLSLINSLHWCHLRLVTNLTLKDASKLYSILETDGCQQPDQAIAREFVSRYPDEMRQMGFVKEHHRFTKRYSHPDQKQLSDTLALVLFALFDFQKNHSKGGMFV